MTPAQLSTFKAAILSDSSQAGNVTANNHGAIVARFLSASATPILRPNIPSLEVVSNVSWPEYVLMSVNAQNAFALMIAPGSVDATKANTISCFQTLFTQATQPNTRAAMGAMVQRNATLFEAVFTSSSISALFGYQPTVADVVAALGGA